MRYTSFESQELARRADDKLDSVDRRIIAIGYLRYEAIRKLHPKAFADIHARNLREDITFDRLVDELILKPK